MRTSLEVYKAFTDKGCKVVVRDLGHSYRAGGEIFIYAPGIDPSSKDGFDFTRADFSAMNGTGYDNRGRRFAVWIVKAGDFVPATKAEYEAVGEGLAFGAQTRSCSNELWFVHRDLLAAAGRGDLADTFAELGI